MTAQVPRILIADDHPIMRLGLRASLESEGWHVAGEAENGRRAVELAFSEKPDAIVMDYNMGELNGAGATREICRRLPATKVLVLSLHCIDCYIEEVIDAGARGFILKTDAGHSVIDGLRAVLGGQLFFSPGVVDLPCVQAILHGLRRKKNPQELTDRELQVVQLLAEGCNNIVAGQRLGITKKTVETHRANIMRKLRMESFADLVRYAVRNGIVPPS